MGLAKAELAARLAKTKAELGIACDELAACDDRTDSNKVHDFEAHKAALESLVERLSADFGALSHDFEQVDGIHTAASRVVDPPPLPGQESERGEVDMLGSPDWLPEVALGLDNRIEQCTASMVLCLDAPQKDMQAIDIMDLCVEDEQKEALSAMIDAAKNGESRSETILLAMPSDERDSGFEIGCVELTMTATPRFGVDGTSPTLNLTPP